MLIRNGSNISIKARLTGSYSGVGFRDAWKMGNPFHRVHAGGLSKYASVPVGYRDTVAYVIAQSDGGIASTSRTSGGASSDAAFDSLADATASVTGEATFTGDATALKDAAGTINGVASPTVSGVGRATIGAVLRIGSTPSADDNAFTLLDSFEVRSGVTVRQALRRAMEGAENAFAVGA